MELSESHKIFFSDQGKSSLSLEARRQKLREWIDQYVPSPGGKVLDIGCWNGDFLLMLPAAWEKWGIDFERHPDLPEGVHFQVANVEERLPVDADCFDLVFAGEIIEHVRATQVFLQRCHETLKPGGILMLTTPILSCWLNLWRWFRLGQPWCVNSDTGQDGHVRYLAPVTLRSSLEKAGFHVLEMASAGGLDFLKGIP
jgi:2-polyprenyl-3-methyl-5-hydroxy-6-metoxy-1,4-benzoquinol methylase